jgi:hypothetical protein
VHRVFWLLLVLSSLLVTGCGDNSQYLPKPRISSDDDEAPPPAPQPNPQPPAPGAPAAAPTASQIAGAPTTPNGAQANGAGSAGNPAGSASPANGSAPAGGPADASPNQKLSELERRKLVIVHLRTIAAALETYRDRNSGYPAPTINGHLSWRVMLLPLLGYGDLYRSFNFNEPWDGPTNRPLLDRIPDQFRSPDCPNTSTCYMLVKGTGAAFANPEGLPNENCRDGIEHTILLVEVHKDLAKPWTAPDDYTFDKTTVQKDWFGMRGECCFAVLGGAAGVRRIAANIPDAQLLGLVTPAGGESIRYQDATTYAHPEIDLAMQQQLQKTPLVRFNEAAVAAASPANGAGETPMTSGGVNPNAAPNNASEPTATTGSTTAPNARVAVADSSDRRKEIPSDEQVEAATATVRELYANEYKFAKQNKDRRDFARRLLDDVERIEADTAGRYVLLKAAREVAAKAGDISAALDACDKLGVEFRVDLLSMKLKVLEQVVGNVQNESELDPLLENGLKLGDESLRLDDFNSAKTAYQIAMSAAKRKRNPSAEKQVTLRETRMRDTKLAYMRITDHVHTLVRSPNDPAANAAVGKYFALLKQDWERGLPMLARGADAKLKTVAVADLAAPAEADAKVAVGDQWWEISENAGVPSEKEGAKVRALYWYELAQPQLGASLQKIRVERRIADVKRENRAERTN